MDNKVTIDTKDLKEVVSFIISLGTSVEKSLKDDGKLTVGDLPNLFPTLFKLMPALQGLENVVLTIKALDKESAEELSNYIKEELKLEDEAVEKFIEDAIRIVLDLWVVLNKYFLKAVPDQGIISDLNGETPVK